MDFASAEYYLSVFLLSSAMVGMGATLSPREFLGVLRAPQGVLAVLIAQIAVTPLLAVALSWLLAVPPGVAFGLVLLAALPGGLYSNLLTYYGRGNVALSIAATGMSTLICIVSTSLVLQLYGSSHLPAGFVMPAGRIVWEIVWFLLVPLAVGMLARRLLPDFAPRLSRICIRTSTFFLALFVIGALGSGRLQLFSLGWRTPLALLLFGSISMWIGVGVASLLRLNPDDRFTVAIEVVVRNGNLGLLIKAALFPAADGGANAIGDGVLFVVLFYAGLSLILGVYEVILKRLAWGVLYRQRADH